MGFQLSFNSCSAHSATFATLFKVLLQTPVCFRFDAAMFDKYHAIDKITNEYGFEKVELENARKALEDIEAEKEFIIEKQRKMEEEERTEALMIIRRNVAAKVIQRAYRNYKARMLLKKKKKKKKTTAATSS